MICVLFFHSDEIRCHFSRNSGPIYTIIRFDVVHATQMLKWNEWDWKWRAASVTRNALQRKWKVHTSTFIRMPNRSVGAAATTAGRQWRWYRYAYHMSGLHFRRSYTHGVPNALIFVSWRMHDIGDDVLKKEKKNEKFVALTSIERRSLAYVSRSHLNPRARHIFRIRSNRFWCVCRFFPLLFSFFFIFSERQKKKNKQHKQSNDNGVNTTTECCPFLLD